MKLLSKSISVFIVTVVSAAAVGSATLMVYHALSDERSNVRVAQQFLKTHPHAIAEFFGKEADAQLDKSENSEESPAHKASPTATIERPAPHPNCPSSEVPSSLAEYLTAQGKAKDLETRKSLAQSYGIADYTGSAVQNTALLKKLYENDLRNCE